MTYLIVFTIGLFIGFFLRKYLFKNKTTKKFDVKNVKTGELNG